MTAGSSGTGGDKTWGNDPDGDSAVATEIEKKVTRPKLYRVLLHNDDYTTMEFVVIVLTTIFHHKEEDAIRIMLHVHNRGIGVAGIFSYEIAETKVKKTMDLARSHEFPLRCSMEPE